MESRIYIDSQQCNFVLATEQEWKNFAIELENELTKETSLLYPTYYNLQPNAISLHKEKKETSIEPTLVFIQNDNKDSQPNSTERIYFRKFLIRKIDSFGAIWFDFLKMFLQQNKTSENAEILKMFEYDEGTLKKKNIVVNRQLTFEELKKEVIQCPLLPNENEIDFAYMMHCLKKLFLRYQSGGIIELTYCLVIE